ncbi:MAG: HEAT repeat domain-containing protein [Deltaproteobacteria bacterium]|nr:HEAT repeat domain-containing protein [Deltaproteobacteria bacterium]
MSSDNGVKKNIPYSPRAMDWAEEFRRSFSPDAGMVDIDFPECGVRDVWEMPPAEVVLEAQKVFEEPGCDETRKDCVTINYLDPLRSERPRILKRIVPSVFEKSEKVRHLAEGIRHLLASYRAVECDAAYVLNDVGIDILLHRGRYLDGAVSQLQSAGAMNAMYGQLRMFTNKLDACSKGQNTCLTQEEALSNLNNLILGYVFCFQQEYQKIIQEENLVEPMSSPPVSVRPELPAKKDFPLIIPPQRVVHADPPKLADLPPKRKERDWEIHREPETPAIKKREGLKDLAEVNKGKIQNLFPQDKVIDKILPRLTLKYPAKHYQIEFLIDASGSMADNVEQVLKQIEIAMEHARKQLLPGGSVTFGVRFYVDDHSERAKPLASMKVLEERAHDKNYKPEWETQQTKAGLKAVVDFIRKTGGGWEYHWDESMKALEQEPWAKEKDVEKVLFLLTDEEGDLGEKEFTAQDVEAKAKAKDVRFEILWMFESNPMEVLAGKSHEVDKIVAIHHLALMDGPEVVSLLLNIIGNRKEKDNVKVAAIEALVGRKDERILPTLRHNLLGSANMQKAIIDIIRNNHDPYATGMLLRLSGLENTIDWQGKEVAGVREEALEALVGRKDPRILPHLKKIVHRREMLNPEDVSAAVKVLDGMEDPEAFSLLLDIADPKKELHRMNALSSALPILAQRRDPRIVPLVESILLMDEQDNFDHGTISRALRALGAQQDPRTVEIVGRYLDSSDKHVSNYRECIETLRPFGVLAVDLLGKLAQNIDTPVRELALETLLKIPDSRVLTYAVKSLEVSEMDGPNHNLFIRRIEKLGNFETTQSLYALRRRQPLRDYLTSFFLTAARYPDPRSLPLLYDVYIDFKSHDSDPYTRRRRNREFKSMFEWAIARHLKPDAIPILLELIDSTKTKDPKVRAMAARDLGKIATPEVLPYVEEALKTETDPEVRAALEKLFQK